MCFFGIRTNAHPDKARGIQIHEELVIHVLKWSVGERFVLGGDSKKTDIYLSPFS